MSLVAAGFKSVGVTSGDRLLAFMSCTFVAAVFFMSAFLRFSEQWILDFPSMKGHANVDAKVNFLGTYYSALQPVTVRALADQSTAHHLIDTILNMRRQRFLRDSPIAREGTFQQRAVLAGRGLAPVDSRYHLITQIPVINHGMRVEQHLRAARGN